MLQALARLFDKRAPDETSTESLEEREHALMLATAALLFEVVRADGRIEDAERSVMRAAIQSTFDLPSSEIDELIRMAETASHESVSLYEFTHRVDKAFAPEQKKRIVELLWLVTFADARKDALEEHLVRKIAGLLHVSHPDFIDAKIRARGTRTSVDG